MTAVRAFALALAAAGLFGTTGCGMIGGLFDDGPSPARRSSAPTTDTDTDDAPPAPRVSLADKLTAGDRAVIERTAARVMARGDTGEPVAWRNPASGNRGTITATSPAYRGRGRRRCRDYQLTVTLGGGRNETVVGTRCRSGARWPRVQ
jgi:hypothetical protein